MVFVFWLFPSNPFLLFRVQSLVYLHAARVFFSNLLEAESSFGYSCSVPLNIIIGFDDYTLQTGQKRLINAKIQAFLFKNNQRTGNCSRGSFLIENTT